MALPPAQTDPIVELDPVRLRMERERLAQPLGDPLRPRPIRVDSARPPVRRDSIIRRPDSVPVIRPDTSRPRIPPDTSRPRIPPDTVPAGG